MPCGYVLCHPQSPSGFPHGFILSRNLFPTQKKGDHIYTLSSRTHLLDTERTALCPPPLLLAALTTERGSRHSYKLTVTSCENLEVSAQYYFAGWKIAYSTIYPNTGSDCFRPADSRVNKYSHHRWHEILNTWFKWFLFQVLCVYERECTCVCVFVCLFCCQDISQAALTNTISNEENQAGISNCHHLTLRSPCPCPRFLLFGCK